jgi:hypothetical protein
MSIAPYAKAVVGGVIMGVTAAVPLVDDGLSVKDGLIIFLAAVAGFNGVYWTPNKDRQALHQQESVQPPTA